MRAELLAELEQRVREAMPWIVSIRRELHRIPELRFEEFRTAERLSEELSGMELEVRTGLAGTGIAAVMTGGSSPDQAADDASDSASHKRIHTLALRADMDALPVGEATGLAFASERPGVMHACGHDSHLAMVLGTARVLASSPVLRQALPGQLKLVFQPAEEGGMGAKAMIGAGVLRDPEVDAALAIHVFPNLPTGEVAVYPRYSHASADSFSVTFRGRGGHGGYPHLARDPLTPMAETLLAYRTLISREVDPLESASLSVCMVRAGEADNVIPDVAELKGALRVLGEELRRRLQQRMVEIAEGLAAAHRVEAQVLFHGGCPATLNHSGVSALIEEEARSLLTDENVHLPAPTLGAEDFAYFTQAVPGALFRLGCTPPTALSWEPLHSPRFQLDEGCLEIGVTLLLRTAFRLLTEGVPAVGAP